MKKEEIDFINSLHLNMNDYQVKNNMSDMKDEKRVNIVNNGFQLFSALLDFVKLIIFLKVYKSKKVDLFYIHTSFIRKVDNEYIDVLFDKLINSNAIMINYDRYLSYARINNTKVYNLGIIVKMLQKTNLIKRETLQTNTHNWLFLNNIICRNLNNNNIFIPAYSNEVGFSLVFNNFRNHFKLIEIQHGSVINYPPYAFVSNLKLVDVFYYKNDFSRKYLEEHLFLIHKARMILMPKVKVQFIPKTDFIELLYISSYEHTTLHPVMSSYLESIDISSVNFRLRLHPRQQNLENNFVFLLNKIGVRYELSHTKMWYDNLPENTYVISPLSSVIEEAIELGLKAVVIDETGFKRYKPIIDNVKCFYTNNLEEFFKSQIK